MSKVAIGLIVMIGCGIVADLFMFNPRTTPGGR